MRAPTDETLHPQAGEVVAHLPDDIMGHGKRRLQSIDELQAKARDVNARLLDTERVGQGCVLASAAFERVAQSTRPRSGASTAPTVARRPDVVLAIARRTRELVGPALRAGGAAHFPGMGLD